MKKILAGVLAAASMLSMTVGASAAENKEVKAAGEVEYDVAVTAPKVTLNLVMPAKMAAALNPYGADIKLDATTTTGAGIASAAYKIENKSTEYGVVLDATAITTVETADKDKWKVTTTAVDDSKKEANMALVAAKDVAALKTVADGTVPTASAAWDDTAQGGGALVMDSTVVANTTTGVAAGQTKIRKFLHLEGSDGAAGGKDEAVIGFVGKLATSDDIEWTEDDAINVALVLKVVAGPKGAGGTSSASGPFSGAMTASVGTLTGDATNGYALGVVAANASATVNFDLKLKSGYAIKSATLGAGSRNTINSTTGAVTLDSGLRSGDSDTITIVVEKTGASPADETTITIALSCS